MAKAAQRNRDHMRRASMSDITARQELEMRQRTRKCQLCGTWMTSKPNLPNSKHLDHILPINQGGTHTHGNVRIICAHCNLSRPWDGSDYVGPLTLWAQGPEVPVSRERSCRAGLHPYMPGRCKRCREVYEAKRAGWWRVQPQRRCQCGALFAAPGNQFMCADCITAAAHKAAALHASGMTWQEVAQQVGYRSANGEGARYAAKRIGYQPAKPEPKVTQVRQCQCGMALQAYARLCDGCTQAAALRAVHLHYDLGLPLRQIASDLGYASITSVTNLMRTVVLTEPRMGRPRKTTVSDSAEL